MRLLTYFSVHVEKLNNIFFILKMRRRRRKKNVEEAREGVDADANQFSNISAAAPASQQYKYVHRWAWTHEKTDKLAKHNSTLSLHNYMYNNTT